MKSIQPDPAVALNNPVPVVGALNIKKGRGRPPKKKGSPNQGIMKNADDTSLNNPDVAEHLKTWHVGKMVGMSSIHDEEDTNAPRRSQ